MTTTPAAGPSAPADNKTTLRLSRLLKRPVADRSGESIGRLADVIVRLRGSDYPLVTGLVAAVGGREIFVPIEQVSQLRRRSDPAVERAARPAALRAPGRRGAAPGRRARPPAHRRGERPPGPRGRPRAGQGRRRSGCWPGWTPGAARAGCSGCSARTNQDDAGVFRDWHDFEWLIGHQGSALLRGPFARIRRLKPAQIADLLEKASKEEETEILGQVHADPELEADVFEELDEDLATRLLGARTDEEIAAVLARMRADDAADAIAELPQRRRQPVLDLLPPGQRTKVLTLMGFNPTSAGGLMAMDFVAVPRKASVADALARVREAVSLQPEALTSVHAVDDNGRLRGVARLVTLVQSDPDAIVIDVSDTDPVRVGPDADITDVAVLMTDYNLITIPVVDDERRLLGVITVDDVLEVTLPDDWRRRETAEPPDAHYGDADREDAQ